MTAGIGQHWEPGQGENLLKPFLVDGLPDEFTVNEGEMISDALVIVRIVDMDPDGDFAERYEYTTTRGLSFAMGRGMIQCTHEQMISFYQDVIDAAKGDDDA